MITITTKKHDEIPWHLLFGALLFAIELINVKDMQLPTIVHDEIGYWTSAAYFNGYNWNGITSQYSYYSYGTGLILALFFQLSNDMTIVYRFVMSFQILLTLFIFLLEHRVYSYLFPQSGSFTKSLCCFLPLIYPTYMYNTGIAWSEHYCLFFMWLNIYLLIISLRKNKLWILILFAVTTVYTYIIHQRNIGVIVCGLGIMTILFHEKKISLRNYIVILSTIGLLIIIHRFIKTDLIQTVWVQKDLISSDNYANVSMNDYSGRFEVLRFALENGGLTSILSSIIGKYMYLVLSSCCLTFGALHFFANIICTKKETLTYDTAIVLYYILFVFVFSFFLCTIVTMPDGVQASRMDQLVYGRYIESTLSPLLLIGCHELFTKRMSSRAYYICLLTSGIATYIVYNVYKYGIFDSSFFASCSTGMYMYWDIIKSPHYVFFAYLIGTIPVYVALIHNKSGNNYLAAVAVALILMFNSLYCNSESRALTQYYNQTVIPLSVQIKQDYEGYSIYYLKTEASYSGSYLELMQYLLPEYSMGYITSDEVDKLTGKYLLCVENMDAIKSNKYEIVSVHNNFKLLRPNANDL